MLDLCDFCNVLLRCVRAAFGHERSKLSAKLLIILKRWDWNVVVSRLHWKCRSPLHKRRRITFLTQLHGAEKRSSETIIAERRGEGGGKVTGVEKEKKRKERKRTGIPVPRV